MAKDPAVLFYTSDFLTGTITMTPEQVGKYIRLLCLQHQKWILTETDMLAICGEPDKIIFGKFVKTENGYFNERMREEAIKRSEYSKSRAYNRTKNKKKFKKDMKKTSKSYVKHMENENEDININNNKKDKTQKGRICTPFGEFKNVLLTDTEYQKLIEEFGKTGVAAIEFLSSYKSEKDYKTKNDNLTIRRWVIDAVKEKEKRNNGTGQRNFGRNNERELPPDIAEAADAITRKWLAAQNKATSGKT